MDGPRHGVKRERGPDPAGGDQAGGFAATCACGRWRGDDAIRVARDAEVGHADRTYTIAERLARAPDAYADARRDGVCHRDDDDEHGRPRGIARGACRDTRGRGARRDESDAQPRDDPYHRGDSDHRGDAGHDTGDVGVERRDRVEHRSLDDVEGSIHGALR